MRFAGETPFVPTDLETSTINYPNIILDYSRLGDEKLGAFAQLDFRVDKKWNFKKVALDLFLEFQNLLGRANPQAPEYELLYDADGIEAVPRQLLLREDDGGSVIPSIGLVLDF